MKRFLLSFIFLLLCSSANASLINYGIKGTLACPNLGPVFGLAGNLSFNDHDLPDDPDIGMGRWGTYNSSGTITIAEETNPSNTHTYSFGFLMFFSGGPDPQRSGDDMWFMSGNDGMYFFDWWGEVIDYRDTSNTSFNSHLHMNVLPPIISLSCFGGAYTTNPVISLYSTGSIVLTRIDPVPEPSTIFLFGLGILGLAGVSRKKK